MIDTSEQIQDTCSIAIKRKLNGNKHKRRSKKNLNGTLELILNLSL